MPQKLGAKNTRHHENRVPQKPGIKNIRHHGSWVPQKLGTTNLALHLRLCHLESQKMQERVEHPETANILLH